MWSVNEDKWNGKKEIWSEKKMKIREENGKEK